MTILLANLYLNLLKLFQLILKGKNILPVVIGHDKSISQKTNLFHPGKYLKSWNFI